MELVLTDAALSDLRSIREYTLKTWEKNRKIDISMKCGRDLSKFWTIRIVGDFVKICSRDVRSQRKEGM